MNSRYFEMIIWAVQYISFSMLLIGFYYEMNKYMHPIRMMAKNKVIGRIYIQDLLVIFILTLVTGIRCNTGSDYYNYYIMYSNVDRWYTSLHDILAQRFQNGYMVLCYLVKLFGGGQFTIFGVVAVLIYIPCIWIFRKYSRNPVASVSCWLLMGYLAMSTNIIKQSLAMTCVLLAYVCYINRKNILFFLLCILGCMFHISVIYVIVILLFSKKIFPTKKLFYLAVGIGFGGMVLLKPILNVASRILPHNYAVYIQNFNSGSVNDMKLQLGGIVVTAFYLFILYSVVNKREEATVEKTRIETAFLTAAILCIPFLFMGIRYYIFNRVAYTGMQFITIFLPAYYSKKNDERSFLNRTLMLVMIVYCLCFTILCAENNYYQYSTIYNDTPMSVTEFVQNSHGG